METRKCENCKGTGLNSNGSHCPWCKGTGKIANEINASRIFPGDIVWGEYCGKLFSGKVKGIRVNTADYKTFWVTVTLYKPFTLNGELRTEVLVTGKELRGFSGWNGTFMIPAHETVIWEYSHAAKTFIELKKQAEDRRKAAIEIGANAVAIQAEDDIINSCEIIIDAYSKNL